MKRRAISLAGSALFATAVFVAAFLLFAVEPLVARYVLPWFGGSPDVWTTCMLFFQATLLAGYAYARLTIRRLPLLAQPLVHLALLGVALAFLPVIPSPGWKPQPGQNPTLRLILLLACTVGPPFFVISGSGPLLQAWLAGTARVGRRIGSSRCRTWARSWPWCFTRS